MIRAAVMLFVTAMPATAQQLAYNDTMRVLAEGRPISAQQGSTNGGSALHEVFIMFGGALYLCHLRGSTTAGTPPNAACWGPRP